MAQVFLVMASKWWESGDYANALIWYETLLQYYQAEKDDDVTNQIWETKYMIGKCLYQCGRHDEALQIFQKTLISLRQTYSADHDEVLEVLNEIALCYCGKGEHPKALEIYQDIEKVDQRKRKYDKDTLVTRSSIAMCYSNMDRLVESKQIYEEVLAEQIKMLGPDHSHVMYTKTNLATCLQRMGKSQQAFEIYQNSTLKTPFGNEHLASIQNKSNQIGCLIDQGRLEDALNMSFDVQRSIEKKYSRKHPTWTNARLELAKILVQSKKFDEAILVTLEVKSIYMETKGEDHQDMLQIVNLLAACYSGKDDYQEALRIQQESLKKFPNADIRSSATLRNNIARTLFDLGRPQDGLTIIDDVDRQMTKLLGEKHPDSILVKKNKAKLLLESDLHQDAAHCFREVELLYKVTCNMKSLLEVRKELMICFLEMNDLNQCLEVYSHLRDQMDDDYELCSIKNKLALKLADTDNYKRQAVKIFKEVERIMEETVKLPATNPALLNTKLNIATCLEELGDQQEADLYFKHIQNIKPGYSG
eukprot:TCONS_00050882-protein